MTFTKRIEWRISRNEYEMILAKARGKGFATIAAYLRSVILEPDFVIEEKIIETNTKVSEILQILKQKQ